MKKLFLILLMMLSCKLSAGTQWVNIPDSSLLKWQMRSDGVVYFRNLNQFDSNHGGCCYRYKLDTTTPAGQALWSVILTKMTAKLPLVLGFPKIPESDSDVQTLSAIGIH